MILPDGSDGKSICLQCGRPRFHPWVGKIPWRRKWQPTPVLLPGKSHGQGSLVGYSPWGHKESDITEWLHFHFHLRLYIESVGINYRIKWKNQWDRILRYLWEGSLSSPWSTDTEGVWTYHTHTHTHTEVVQGCLRNTVLFSLRAYPCHLELDRICSCWHSFTNHNMPNF